MKYIGLDLETTGLNAENDKIIEIAAILFDDEKIIDSLSTTINPEVPIPKNITQITGITDSEVSVAPTINQIEEEFKTFISTYPLVGHNVQFDINFLEANGFNLKENPVLDTFHIASLLMSGEKSLSLEVITDKLGFSHESAHRAYDDTKACVELFWYFQKEIEKLPEETKKFINYILSKSKHELKSLLYTDNLEAIKDIQAETLDTLKSKFQINIDPKFKEATTDINETNINVIDDQAFLVKIEDYIKEFSEKAKKQIIIYDESLKSKKHLETYLNEQNISHNFLEEPKCFLSVQSLLNFLNKPNFSRTEAHVLIKLLVWLGKTNAGNLQELIFYDKEKRMLPLLKEKINSGFYAKNLEKSQNSQLTFVSQTNLLAIKDLEDLQNKELTVFSPGTLINNISNVLATNTTREEVIEILDAIAPKIPFPYDQYVSDFINQIDMFFGLIGIFLEEQTEVSREFTNIAIDHSLKSSAKWKNIESSSQNIKRTLDDLSETLIVLFKDSEDFNQIKNSLESLSVALNQILSIVNFEKQTSINTILYRKSNSFFRLRQVPMTTNQYFKETLWPYFNNVNIIGSNSKYLMQNPYLKHELGLEDKDPEITSISNEDTPKNIKYNFCSENSITSKVELHNALIETAVEDLNKNPQNTVIIAASENEVKTLYFDLIDKLPTNQFKILGMGMSGGRYKILHMFNKSDKPAILICTSKLLNFIGEKELEYKNVYLQRLPYIIKQDPIHKKRIEFCSYQFGMNMHQYDNTLSYLLLVQIINQVRTITTSEDITINFFQKLG